MEVEFLGHSVNTPVILLAIASYFFTGTRPAVWENVCLSHRVTDREGRSLSM